MAESTLSDVMRVAFGRIGEITVRHQLDFPLTIMLLDASERHILTTRMVVEGGNWTSSTESGELHDRGNIPFPWFMTLKDARGRSAKLRIELESEF